MEITTKFNVGDVAYYLKDKQNIRKGKIEKIVITNYNDKDKDIIDIAYKVEGIGSYFDQKTYLNQNEIFKDFEDFKNVFCLKFEEANKFNILKY